MSMINETETSETPTPTETETSPPDVVEQSPLPADLPDVDGLVERLATLRRQSDHEVREIYVRGRVGEFRKQFTVSSVFVAPADAVEKFRAAIEAEFLAARADEAKQAQRDLAEAERGLAAAARDAERLRAEPELLPRSASASERLLARLVSHTEREAATRRVAGWTAEQARRVYQATGDGQDRELVRAIEAAHDTGTLRVESDVDADGLVALQRAIGARRLARVPAAIREALATVQQIRADVTGQILLESIARGGR